MKIIVINYKYIKSNCNQPISGAGQYDIGNIELAIYSFMYFWTKVAYHPYQRLGVVLGLGLPNSLCL